MSLEFGQTRIVHAMYRDLLHGDNKKYIRKERTVDRPNATPARLLLISLMLLSLLILWVEQAEAQQLAFPGALGFGRFTTGGRGGAVLQVTNLEDDGPGSLRAAISVEDPRTIVFQVSGIISLKSNLLIRHGNLTIAGQTAPGDGICLRNYPLIIKADNVIIRYLRIRLGDLTRVEEDAVTALFQKNIIIDHCSMSWGIDEVTTVRDNKNTTVQWCIVSESLNHSFHHKGDHGYAGIWGGKGASFYYNLIAHHTSRTPRFNGSRYHGEPERELVDFRNNVIFNWGFNSGYGGEGGRHNIINNYYKSGPASKHRDRIVEPWNDQGRWYIAGNYVQGFPEITDDNWAGGVQGKFWRNIRSDSVHQVTGVPDKSAQEAFKIVLTAAGATLPKRDAIDRRIVAEVKSGKATYGGVWGSATGIIDSQSQVGGWPNLISLPPPSDGDGDGMPDNWEKAHGLNPADPDDRNSDQNSDGYTNLEEYLNALTKGASASPKEN